MLASKILVNVHEPPQIINCLQQHTSVEVKNFTPGDYLVGEYALERKTLPDFLASYTQGRLFEQLFRLKSCYLRPVLLIEGDLNHLANGRVFYGILLSILLNMNLRFILTLNHQQTAEVLLLMAGRARQYPFIRYRPKQSNIAKQRFDLLKKIPGIGKERARVLLNQFETLHNIFIAEEKELVKVQGIGKKSIENIRKI